MKKYYKCPFCGEKIYIGVCDNEGNYHGELGCDYEENPWSGICYGLYHRGWGDCILCSDESPMGGILFDTIDDIERYLNELDFK